MNEILKLFLSSYTFKVVTLGCALLGIVSAIIGTFAVLKKESLLGDGISHSALAGICLAFLISGKKELYILLTGALVIGFLCIFLIHYIERNSKVKLDSAIALLLSTFFGLGLVLLTYLKKVPGAKKAGLNMFIFGQASTLIAKDIYLIIIVGLVLISLVILFWKEIKISIFQADYAKTLGIQIAGVILMTAMLVLPSVAARQWSKKLSIVTVLAAIIGGISGAMGSIISTLDASLPTGPLIILVSGIFVLISFLFSKKGIIARNYRIQKRNRKLRLQESKGDGI